LSYMCGVARTLAAAATGFTFRSSE
jgi:hypothetical protein